MIVDDEPHAIEVIETYLKNFSEVKVVETCNNGISAFKVLQNNSIDLLFLDIKMPSLTGVELLKSLKNPPKVIFTTAYAEYAVEGFELEAVDYLIKPISFNRFLKAMDKILRNFKSGYQSIIPENIKSTDVANCIYLKVERKTHKVNIADILWIESQKDYVKVVLKDKELLSKNKISLIEALLPEDAFIRIHRSYIIALSKVDSFYSYAVSINNKQIPIGRNYKTEVQEKFKKGFLAI